MASKKFKICLIGDAGVGKTSLIARYIKSDFDEKYHTTVGVKVDKKTLKLENADVVDLIIWDIAGGMDSKRSLKSYLTGVKGFFFVADGTRINTLKTVREMMGEILGKSNKGVSAIVAINKSDLKDVWQYDEEQKALMKQFELPIFETSAKEGFSVEDAFLKLATDIDSGSK